MWSRVDDNIPHHPKFVKAGPVASWLWVCGNCYSNRYLTDGFISFDVISTLGQISNARGYADKLVEVGLWESAPDGFIIHDFHDHNPKSSEVKAKRERDRERKKKHDEPGRNSQSDSEDVPRGFQAESPRIPTLPARAIPSHPIPSHPKETGNSGPAPILVRGNPHKNHACCGKVCLHSSQFETFVKMASSQADANRYVREFFGVWDDRYQTGDRSAEIIGDDAFDFWRARWSETHPTAKGRRKSDEVELDAANARQRAEIAKGAARRKSVGL